MPLLFSYGTLQEHDVQRSTFGRLLGGAADALPHYALSSIQGQDVVYANVVFDGESSVPGTVFDVTEAELAAADAYEEDAAYIRKIVTLASGKRAWVYVHGG